MDIDIKERASRFRRISNDEAFKEILDGVKQEQIGIFLHSSATMEQIKVAKDTLRALSAIEAYIKSALDAEVMHDLKDK